MTRSVCGTQPRLDPETGPMIPAVGCLWLYTIPYTVSVQDPVVVTILIGNTPRVVYRWVFLVFGGRLLPDKSLLPSPQKMRRFLSVSADSILIRKESGSVTNCRQFIHQGS